MNKLLEDELRKTAKLLDKWVRETQSGGWSTQHVEPMTKQADEIWSLLARIEDQRNPIH